MQKLQKGFLEDLGFKSSNDRLYVGLFKTLGLVDESGQPTQRYFEFIDQTETNRVLAIGIEEAYEDLFNLRKDAQNLTYDEVKNKFKTLTQGQKSDNVVSLMATTFKALCEIADWSKKETIKTKTSLEDKVIESAKDKDVTSTPITRVADMNLHYNIQIHLPETTNMAVYDAIFQSLKKHLL